MKQLLINKELLPMKAHYFLFNAGTGPVTPYLSTYARQLGFSSVVVGFVYTILPISGMLAKPLFGSIADRFHCQKMLFLASQILLAAAFLAVFYSPKIESTKQVQLRCYNNSYNFLSNYSITNCTLDDLRKEQIWNKCEMSCQVSSTTTLCNEWNLIEYCQENHSDTLSFTAFIPTHETQPLDDSLLFKMENITLPNGHILTQSCTTNLPLTACQINCQGYTVNDYITETSVNNDDVYGLYQFWCFLIFMILAWIAQAVVVSIGDTICFELLGDKPNRYGYQRLWGSLGWGIVSAMTGVLIDASSQGTSQKNYTSAFYMGAAFLFLDFFVSTRIKYSHKKVSTNIFRDVTMLLLDVRILVFIVWCVIVGMCTGLMWQFQFWLIEDLASDQGCSGTTYVKTLEGLIQGIQTILGEAPFFFLSGKIIQKISHVHTMSLVLFAIGIRFILYSVVSNPWYFLPIEVSNGLTFGLFFACMASYASKIAPSGTEATMQGMVGALFEGVGVSSGSALAGFLYQTYGGPLTFRYFGFGALVTCAIHIIIQYLLKGSQNEYSIPEENIERIQREDEKELTYLYPR
ncbi:major facilitator superfamily domain-containing protein 6-like isoform X1 [Diorhabda carinulata]|uniref:major facilitator superfamily domain-containing protein 6-like isoform X1 n=1 Tax=Diorhabda carinulata TaxID=1163345 RepID=UPI0025A0DA6E|nr:major facilitator superfamily domain-containing protein 6-like isoform X1 [Diorhabda carinulata]